MARMNLEWGGRPEARGAGREGGSRPTPGQGTRPTGWEHPPCRPGALTGRCERVSARMKAAILPPLGGFGAIIPPPNWRKGARASRKELLCSGDCLRKPRGHGNGWPPNGTWAVGPTFPIFSAKKEPKVARTTACLSPDYSLTPFRFKKVKCS